jgi:hypothetical protein
MRIYRRRSSNRCHRSEPGAPLMTEGCVARRCKKLGGHEAIRLPTIQIAYSILASRHPRQAVPSMPAAERSELRTHYNTMAKRIYPARASIRSTAARAGRRMLSGTLTSPSICDRLRKTSSRVIFFISSQTIPSETG